MSSRALKLTLAVAFESYSNLISALLDKALYVMYCLYTKNSRNTACRDFFNQEVCRQRAQYRWVEVV